MFWLLALLATAALSIAQSTTYNLDAALNAGWVTDLIDTKLYDLKLGISRNSKVHTTVVQWSTVPGPVKPRAGGAHPDSKHTIRVDVGVHVNTPWFCPAVDGSVTYYLWPTWDAPSRRVRLKIDGWDTHTDLLSICQGDVNRRLQQQVPQLVPNITSLVDAVFNGWNGQRWIGCEQGVLSIDQELPGVLPGCAPKPPPQCPPPRPPGKPPRTCDLVDSGDGCGSLKCVCRAGGDAKVRGWVA